MNLEIAASHSESSSCKANAVSSVLSKFETGGDSEVVVLTAKFVMDDVGTKIFSCGNRFVVLRIAARAARNCHKDFNCLRFQVAIKIL